MQKHVPEALALALPAPDRVGKRHADQKSKAGLDGVVEAHARPLHMGLVVTQNVPECAAGVNCCRTGKVHHLAHHQQHHEAAIGIDCHIALLLHSHLFDKITHQRILTEESSWQTACSVNL